MNSWPTELVHKETGEIIKVYAIDDFGEEFEILIKKGRRTVVAHPDEWDILTVNSKIYVYSMIKKEIKPFIFRRTI